MSVKAYEKYFGRVVAVQLRLPYVLCDHQGEMSFPAGVEGIGTEPVSVLNLLRQETDGLEVMMQVLPQAVLVGAEGELLRLQVVLQTKAVLEILLSPDEIAFMTVIAKPKPQAPLIVGAN